jgi:hypothetical protein
MSKYSQGEFVPLNPQKLVGNARPHYRSSWELKVMTLLDNHPSVIQWASESIRIPYVNPLTNKPSTYVPDFLVLFQDKTGKTRAELIEVKPGKEAMAESAMSKRDKLMLLVNTAKWRAAMEWCHKNGITFRVLTEQDIYITHGQAKKRKGT